MIPIGETQDGRADMTNFEMDLFDTRMNSYTIEKEESEQCCKHSIIKPACVPISIISLFIFMIVFFPLFSEEISDITITRYERSGVCYDNCITEIVESIPTNLTYTNYTSQRSTYDAWKLLLDGSTTTTDLAVFYWSLRDNFSYPTQWQGNDIFNRLISAAKRGVKIRIVQNSPTDQMPQLDSEYLKKNNLALVRNMNFKNLLGSGVLHTKFWIVDHRHIYIGSANMDWKSLTEVKELGYLFLNCSCLASDLAKVFSVYWRLGIDGAKIPPKWPLSLRTYFNFTNPLKVLINEKNGKAFFANSPKQFNGKGREIDSDAIIKIMEDAKDYISISVMDYLPTTLYMDANNSYWPIIDDAIRSAAYRGTHVRLLVSSWNHTKRAMFPYLKSLVDINDALPVKHGKKGRIDVKIFTVPSDAEQSKIPFARVKHDKYMVTDKVAYVGTSNWVGDYFITTAGVGAAISSKEMIDLLNAIFMRDWKSEYAEDLQEFL